MTDYIGSTSWVQDYVTGVYSFNLSSYGSAWEYKTWPAPAVGRSRALNPPAQQCDGLVCSGGSQSVLAEAPFPCPIGHYCRAGVTTQIPMVKNFSTPQRCFDGFFCPRGSRSPEGSGPCPNKYFCPTQLDALECPEGLLVVYILKVSNHFLNLECSLLWQGTTVPEWATERLWNATLEHTIQALVRRIVQYAHQVNYHLKKKCRK